MKKKETITDIQKQSALETIRSKYPENNWLPSTQIGHCKRKMDQQEQV